tara:strand:+ start:3019 stop:3240 length:222 start_codon:yes stop_codon:yes gene_type:complete
MSDDTVIHTKIWKDAGTFTIYEDAAVKRDELLEKFDLVKIRRFGRGGLLYKIKTWKKPLPKITKKKNKSNNTA